MLACGESIKQGESFREEYSKEEVTFELRHIRCQLALGSLGGRKFQMEEY